MIGEDFCAPPGKRKSVFSERASSLLHERSRTALTNEKLGNLGEFDAANFHLVRFDLQCKSTKSMNRRPLLEARIDSFSGGGLVRELPLEEQRRLGIEETDCKAMESFRERNREF